MVVSLNSRLESNNEEDDDDDAAEECVVVQPTHRRQHVSFINKGFFL